MRSHTLSREMVEAVRTDHGIVRRQEISTTPLPVRSWYPGPEVWLGKVGEHIEGARYMVSRSAITSGYQTELAIAPFPGGDAYGITVDATNTAEIGGGGGVAMGSVVTVIQRQQPDGHNAYWFTHGGGSSLDYCLIREVVDTDTLRIHRVKRVAGGIEVNDTDVSAKPLIGVPGEWYAPLVWTGEPTMIANYPLLTTIRGELTVLQTLKFELIPPPDPLEFPPGGCFLRPRGG